MRSSLQRSALGLFLALAMIGAVAAAAFLSAIEDLPLMPGLAELEGKGLVYDKPDGRIVEAYAEGRVAAAEVRRFYAETLPQLGWQAAGESTFRREGERLDVQVLSEGEETLVRFTLQPE